MFKDIQKGLMAFFTKERVLVLMIFILLTGVLFSYAGLKTNTAQERMTMFDPSPLQSQGAQMQEQMQPSQMQAQPAQMQMQAPAQAQAQALNTVNPSELLPVDQNSEWAALNPNSLSQGNVLMPDLLQAGYHIGLDTIGQTLRNANYQLRSDPYIPKSEVGPWNQSTIEADLARVPLELGEANV